MLKRLLTILLCFSISLNLFAEEKAPKITVDAPVVTKHRTTINGYSIDYTATTGYLTLKSEAGEEEAHLFFVAYTKDDVSNIEDRPLTFSFNGGPGSSSVWLHLGVLGPHRVKMDNEGHPTPPPFELERNDYSWLDLTDMVFIDPVSTGFSRAVEEKSAKNYHGVSGDINSVADFIRRYVSENKRWSSPKYVIGESYGTTRAAGLTDRLIDKYGMYLNGTILVSAITNFQTARFTPGNDLPYPLFLPTYAATAWYHKRLPADLQSKTLNEFLDEVEVFALTEYNTALMFGDRINEEAKQKVVKKLAHYIGVSEKWAENALIRPIIWRFTKELLRDDLMVVGRFDSRYKMKDIDGVGEYGEYDPSYQPTILGSYGTCINAYLTEDLNFKTHLPYEILTSRVHPWKYDVAKGKFLNTAENLRKAMVKNPNMKIWVANGYYDLATPYFATEYTFDHMMLTKELKQNISMTYYEAGHMMYLQKKSLIQMKSDAVDFYNASK